MAGRPGWGMKEPMTAPARPKPFLPKYGYRRSDGWRQKILYADRWDYPRPAKAPPFGGTFFVHPRRAWRTLFFARAFGLDVVAVERGRPPRAIRFEVPAGVSHDRLRRLADHVQRSGLARERIGLPSFPIGRFAGRQRPGSRG